MTRSEFLASVISLGYTVGAEDIEGLDVPVLFYAMKADDRDLKIYPIDAEDTDWRSEFRFAQDLLNLDGAAKTLVDALTKEG